MLSLDLQYLTTLRVSYDFLHLAKQRPRYWPWTLTSTRRMRRWKPKPSTIVPPGQCRLMTSCSNNLGMFQSYVGNSPSGLWDHSAFVSWGPGRHYPVWLQLPLPMVELLVCSIISLSPTAFKTLDRLLTMAITISIISFVGTIAVASSLSEIASIYPTAGGIRAPATQPVRSVAKMS